MSWRIAAVRAHVLEATVDEPVTMSFGVLDRRRMVLVEVESSDGIIGYGESWANYPSWASTERVATIEEGIAPALVGTELENVRPVVDRLRARLIPQAIQWGAVGALHQAMSGVEIALLDLVGKGRGVPVASLLGGLVRREVPVYASALSPEGADELADQCVARGFRTIKCRVGFGAEVDKTTLAATRSRVGEDIRLCADANQAWSVPRAVEAIRMLAAYGVEWFEEPVRGNRLDDLETVFHLTGAGLATGENSYGLHEFARLACSPAVRVLQPDVSKAGGIRATDLVAEIAAATGTELIPHVYGGPVALAATAQLAGAAQRIAAIEYDIRPNPLTGLVVDGLLEVEDGQIVVPDGPGLGIKIDPAVVSRYSVRPGALRPKPTTEVMTP